MNWSKLKKFFVTFQICLLTFSIYIGSSIYSAGLQSVSMEFGVSEVAGDLGLTLFVAGYGVGPMLWSPMSEIPMIGMLQDPPSQRTSLKLPDWFRPKSNLYEHVALVCPFTASHRVCSQFWHASSISVYYWIYWLTMSRDWGCIHRRHV